MSRVTASPPDGTVLFVVGMRVNRWWAVHKWLPVALAMPRMIQELTKDRLLGMIGRPRTLVSGRLIVVQQYWTSYEALEAYAGAAGQKHLPAWRAFNKAARGNQAVGIFHETYVIGAGTSENIYVNVPQPILLASAVGADTVGAGQNSSRQRLRRQERVDEPSGLHGE